MSPFAQKAVLTGISTVGTIVFVDLLIGGTIKSFVHNRQVIRMNKLQMKHEETMAAIQAAKE